MTSVLPVDLQPGVESLTEADAHPLTKKMRDDLARLLENDWKGFARGTAYFNDGQIDIIDAGARTRYDKCLNMLTIYEQSSTVTVTIAMIKLNLIKINRTDILNHIFNAKRLNKISEGQANVVAEPTIRDLTYKHIDVLCQHLDPTGISNWKELGLVIAQGDTETSEKVESLHNSYYGGGSPAREYLKALVTRKPSLSVIELINVAKEIGRNDVAVYLERNISSGKLWKDVEYKHIEKVARILERHTGTPGWKHLAYSFDFTEYEVSMVELAIKQPNQYSPTQGLIRLLQMTYPTLTLLQIKMAASSIKRNDVVSYLNSVIEEVMASAPN